MKIHYHLRKLLASIAVAACTLASANAADPAPATYLYTADNWDASLNTVGYLTAVAHAPTADGNIVTVDGVNNTTQTGRLYGAYTSTGNANKNVVTLQNGTALFYLHGGYTKSGEAAENVVNLINSSVQYNLYGGYRNDSGGSVHHNSVVLKDNSYARLIYGGEHLNDGDSIYNSVELSGGSSASTIYASHVSGIGNASYNTALLSGASSAATIYGGYLGRGGNASYNTIGVSGASTVTGKIIGGYVGGTNGTLGENGTFSTENVASENSVTISGQSSVNKQVFGGYAETSRFQRETDITTSAINNTVTITGGSSVADAVYGGYAQLSYHYYTPGEITISATGNNVVLSDEASAKTVYGGYVGASFQSTVTAEQKEAMSISTSASGNSVSITDSSVSEAVYGGFVAADAGDATNNTITLAGNGDFSAASIYGGGTDNENHVGDLITGNKLVLNNFNGTLGTVTNFETITTAEGTTETTITGGTLTANSMSFNGATSISDATLTATAGDIDFTGASVTLSNTTLNVGDAYEIYVDSQTTLNLGSGVTFNGTLNYTPGTGGEGGEGGNEGGSAPSGPTIGLGTGQEENNEYVLTDSVDSLISTPGTELKVNTENLVIDNSGLSKDSSIVTTQASGNIEIASTAGTPEGENVTYTLGSLDTSSASTEGENTGITLSNNVTKAGDTTIYQGNLTKNEHTTQRIDVSVTQTPEEEAPAIVTDTVKVEGVLDAQGARVLLTSPDAPVNRMRMRAAAPAGNGDFVLADQTVMSIVEAHEVISGYNEDVMYEIDEQTGLRKLQSMNAWVRTTDDGAEFVFSQNYRSAEGKTAIQQEVSEVLQQVSPLYGQGDGERKASDSRFVNMLDAFDHTRSAAAAKRGLTSVSGVSTTIAQHAVMDGSRHHMDTLRRWISLPECPVKTVAAPAPVTVEANGKAPRTVAAAPAKEDPRSSVWATYTGGYDMVDDPAHEMGGYTRSSQGALLGYSRSLNCNMLLGLALGYENSISRSDSTRHDADSGYLDVYGAARTGRYNHRFSAGVGFHCFDAKRGVYVEAPGHSFSGTGTSEFDARSLNLGYELSTDVALSERSFLSPFFALNYAHHSFDTVTESGLGDAGLITELESINQLEAAFGARYAYSFNLVKNQAPATFTASAELKAEFADHAPNAWSRFAGHHELGFRTESLERSPLYGEIGAGLKVPFTTQWTGSASASYEFGSDRNAINVGAGVNYSF